MIWWIVYVTGYITVYYVSRYIVKRDPLYDWKWSDVGLAMFISFMSWGFIIIGIIVTIVYTVFKRFPKKPPKWL